MRPIHDESSGEDGFVSLELAPGQALDTEGSRRRPPPAQLINEPNVREDPRYQPGHPAVRRW